ncbi:hypothetical protein SNEBB_008549 [Seison nebaliae]|nr:hypothetical protein SNEBB_008549 [Seison nebaliae]
MFRLISLLSLFIGSIWMVELHLYTRSNRNSFVKVSLSDYQSSSNYRSFSKLYMIIHGYTNKPTESWLIRIKNELLSAEDANVIIVDWSAKARSPYSSAAKNVKGEADIVGAKIPVYAAQKLHCIGFSLGAHFCGFIGKKVKSVKHLTIPRITGLDPAGPAYKNRPVNSRLDKTDAQFVDIMHTSVMYGIFTPIGHQDFYVNGGQNQHGCGMFKRRSTSDMTSFSTFDDITQTVDNEDNAFLDEVITGRAGISCSHSKAYKYYTESIVHRNDKNCQFNSFKCDSWVHYSKDCNRSPCSNCPKMGYGLSARHWTDGMYYVETSSTAPYCT